MRRGKKEISKVQELAYELKVKDAMTKKVVVVTPQNSIGELREILRVNRISGAPVLEHNKLVGIISIEDFIKCLAQGEIKAAIGKKMSQKVITLYADDPLTEAVNKFDQYGFGRFPVIDRKRKKLVGIITKGDIIKALLRELEVDYHEEEIHRYRASHIFEDISADRTTLIFEYNVTGQDFKHAGESSSRLKKNLTRLGIDPQIIRRVAISTYEAEMNIVIFTPKGEITAYIQPDKIIVKARDTGPGIEDIEKAMTPGFSTAPERIRELGFGAGMGLPNIKNCADKLKINSKLGKGTELEFIIQIKDK
jgi:CBS domain-containing protein/anti-sigma regulatory factor (Ser/Thr protein kinase)